MTPQYADEEAIEEGSLLLRKTSQTWLLLLATVLGMLPVQPAAAELFYWPLNQPTTPMKPVSTHWCYLAEVYGKFRGFAEKVDVRVVDGRWVLSGSGQTNGVHALANCVATSLFKANGPARWASEPFARQWGDGTECNSNPIPAWWGDAATAITGFGGDFQGGGEYIEVKQSIDAKKRSIAYSHTCRSQAYAAVTSFFAGKPHIGKLAKFIGPGGALRTADKAGEYSVKSGDKSVKMAGITEAMCYLTYVGGGFHGGGEGVSIQVGAGYWYLQADSKSGDGVRARARCLAYDQLTYTG